MAISCQPADLVKAAKCFPCVPKSARRWVKSYLLCQLSVKPGGVLGMVAPTGFQFTLITGPSAQASWNTPPGSVTATEVWTSTDGITYALAATVAAPGTTSTLTAPAVGTVLFAQARWVYGSNGPGPFCSPGETFGNVTDWANRVVANGSGVVTTQTISAMNTFYGALNSVGTLIAKIKSMVCMTPASIVEACTPLIKTFGNDPWSRIAGLNYEITVNGLRATAVNGALDTGVIPSACFASTATGGLTAYVFTSTNNDGVAVDMGSNNSNAQTCQLYTNFSGAPGSAFGQIYNNSTGSVTGTAHGAGFWCTNVNAGPTSQIYYGSSSTGFTTAGSLGSGGGTRPTFSMFAMGLSASGATAGTTQVRRYSFFAIHDGLTQAEAQALYNAVQALRTALGGGFI